MDIGMKIHHRIDLAVIGQILAGKRGVCVLPGQSMTLDLDLPARDYPVRRKFRGVGEVDLFWRWRHEGGVHLLYRSIRDALDSKRAFGERYSLKLTGNGENWPRNAYMKVPITPEMAVGGPLTFSVMVCTDGVYVDSAGELGVELGIYRANPARHPGDISDLPDETVRMEIPPGTQDWRELSVQVQLKPGDVLGLVRVGGRKFKGVAWVGSPRLFGEGGDTVIPPFMPETSEENWRGVVWMGENLSRVEWPEFSLAVDDVAGRVTPVFLGMSRGGEFELDLPKLSAGKHRLTLTLHGDYETALPFNVWEAMVLEEGTRPIELIGHAQYAEEGKDFGVLVEVNSGDEHTLKVVSVPAGKARENPTFEVQVEGQKLAVSPKRVVTCKGAHDVIVSVSEHHVPQEVEAFKSFISWYVANDLGNGIGFRPIYNWTGSRQVNPQAWQMITPLLNDLGMRYFLIRDGRALPGRAANPADGLLAGPGFLGRQLHERDGNYIYGAFKRQWDAFWGDLFRRPADPGENLILDFKRMLHREGRKIRLHVPEAADMRQASLELVANLDAERNGATRHTGPTTLFNYFYDAGYDWVGAETMYGPEDVLLSALRGASVAVGKTDFGAHLAMSWSSAPHDTSAHAERYFLSLAACYLHGVNQINLEDGLMRMDAEYASHDVYSHACQIHRDVHARFRKFVQTHPRRGTMRAPVGVLRGRYCGWQCFYRENVFGNQRPDFKFGPSEESFDLMRVFYPRAELECIYRLKCTDDKPEGWYTGTPYGQVDVVPLAVNGPLEGYRALVFLGWNTFEEQDFARLLAYVEQGGTLLLSRKHLSTHVVRNQACALPRVSEALTTLLGGPVALSGAKIERRVGKGRVVYFPQDAYPSEVSLRAAYEAELKAIGAAAVEAESKRGWIAGNEDVNFSVYDREDGLRVIYLVNTDWWSGRTSAAAALLWGGERYEITVPAGEILVITIGEKIVVLPEGVDVDVISIEGRSLTLQSDAGAKVRVFEHGKPVRVVEVKGGGVRECEMSDV